MKEGYRAAGAAGTAPGRYDETVGRAGNDGGVKMRFSNYEEQMEWKILKYQYPEAEPSVPGNYNYNANWLTFQVSHEREGYGPAVFRESFLMTFELQDLIKELQKIADGDAYYYKGEFIEPVLEVEATRQRDKVLVSFDLVFDNYEMMVADTVDDEGLLRLIGELQELADAYPER
ncbi:MAG: hypothetical protein IKF16_03460 [Lachnospiraceae bacterium]|nr:hypothetical protein [Lachnospiraceae bacterium]